MYESVAAATGYPHRRRRGARESMKQIGRSAYTARPAIAPATSRRAHAREAQRRRPKTLTPPNSKPFVRSRSTERYFIYIHIIILSMISDNW